MTFIHPDQLPGRRDGVVYVAGDDPYDGRFDWGKARSSSSAG
jgi:hypothetical protein